MRTENQQYFSTKSVMLMFDVSLRLSLCWLLKLTQWGDPVRFSFTPRQQNYTAQRCGFKPRCYDFTHLSPKARSKYLSAIFGVVCFGIRTQRYETVSPKSTISKQEEEYYSICVRKLSNVLPKTEIN